MAIADQQMTIDNVKIKMLESGSVGARRDLRLEVFESKNNFLIKFLVNQERFPDVSTDFTQEFMDILHFLLNDSAQPIAFILNS